MVRKNSKRQPPRSRRVSPSRMVVSTVMAKQKQRRPRLLTPRRMGIIRSFYRKTYTKPSLLAFKGYDAGTAPSWIKAVIRELAEPKHRMVEPSDVLYWLEKFPDFFEDAAQQAREAYEGCDNDPVDPALSTCSTYYVPLAVAQPALEYRASGNLQLEMYNPTRRFTTLESIPFDLVTALRKLLQSAEGEERGFQLCSPPSDLVAAITKLAKANTQVQEYPTSLYSIEWLAYYLAGSIRDYGRIYQSEDSLSNPQSERLLAITQGEDEGESRIDIALDPEPENVSNPGSPDSSDGSEVDCCRIF